MDDNDEKRGPWESREWELAEPEPGPPEPPEKRPPAVAGWIGVAFLLGSGLWPWIGGGQMDWVGMGLSAFMVTTGVAVAFVLVRRWFVPPEKDGRS